MKWTFDGEGEWTALSQINANWMYRIQVCEDGTFDISRSNRSLQLDGAPCLSSLTAAKLACETREGMVCRQMRGLKKCLVCGDFLTGHEDESGTHFRFCVTCIKDTPNEAIAESDNG